MRHVGAAFGRTNGGRVVAHDLRAQKNTLYACRDRLMVQRALAVALLQPLRDIRRWREYRFLAGKAVRCDVLEEPLLGAASLSLGKLFTPWQEVSAMSAPPWTYVFSKLGSKKGPCRTSAV